MDTATSRSDSIDEDNGSFIIVPSRSCHTTKRNAEKASMLEAPILSETSVNLEWSTIRMFIKTEKFRKRMHEMRGYRRYDIGNSHIVIMNPLKHVTGVADHAFLSRHKHRPATLLPDDDVKSSKKGPGSCLALVLYRPTWLKMVKGVTPCKVEPSRSNILKETDRLTIPSTYYLEQSPRIGRTLFIDLEFTIILKRKDTTLSFASTCRKAVDLFNRHEPSRYTWMRCLLEYFLPRSEISQAILNNIKRHSILWSEPTASTPSCLYMPSDLLYVPLEFRDRNGASLLNVNSLSRYQELSQQYQKNDQFAIQQLGVRTLDPGLFKTMLSQIDLTEQTASWHEALATSLLQVCPLSSFSHLHLIPLEQPKASWISIHDESRPVYLWNDKATGAIPTGLGINLIEYSASQNPHRAELFLQLSAVPLEPGILRKHILDLHQRQNKIHLAHSCSITDLVSHAKFLFRNGQSHELEDLSNQVYFADHRSRKCCLQLYRGGRLYCPGDDPLTGFSPSRSLSVCPDVKFLHSYYLSKDLCDGVERIEWLNWLHKQAGLSYFPRLFEKRGDSTTKASNVLREWIEKSPLDRLVTELAKHWNSFGVLLSHNIRTREALRLRLKGVMLPLPKVDALALEMEESPFLNIDIPIEKFSDFQKLEVFGVTTMLGPRACLDVLEHLQQQKSPVPMATLHTVYKRLQECSSEQEQLIRDSFNNKRLILVVRNSPSITSWMAPEWCVWGGPSSLKLHPPLSSLFPGCEKLFCDILEIARQPTVKMLAWEAKYQLEGLHNFPVEDIKPLLFGLARHLEAYPKDGEWEETLKPLLSLNHDAIFPVKYPDELEASLVSRHEYFFVPDRTECYNLFRGSIPMLDVSVEEAEVLQPLLNSFGGNIRNLSQSIKGDWTIKGKEALEVSWTLMMRSKVPEFLRIISHYVPNLTTPQQEKVLKWLTTSCFIRTEAIEHTSEVTYPKRNSTETMTVRASTPADLCGASSSEGYLIYIAKNNRQRTETVVHDELPSLLTQYFGLEQFDGAEAMIGSVVRLDEEQAVAALDGAGIARVPDSLKKAVSRMNIMCTARTRTKEEARWAFAAWVKRQVFGVERGKEDHGL